MADGRARLPPCGTSATDQCVWFRDDRPVRSAFEAQGDVVPGRIDVCEPTSNT